MSDCLIWKTLPYNASEYTQAHTYKPICFALLRLTHQDAADVDLATTDVTKAQAGTLTESTKEVLRKVRSCHTLIV